MPEADPNICPTCGAAIEAITETATEEAPTEEVVLFTE
jgi:hypothetical protein